MFLYAKYLKLLDNHEAEQAVESIEAECAQGVLDLREQPVVGDLLVAPQVVPGVHLVDVAGYPVKSSNACQGAYKEIQHLQIEPKLVSSALY